jgi:hypothetical protein
MASQEDLTGRGQEARSDFFYPYCLLSLTGIQKKNKKTKNKKTKKGGVLV